MGKCKKTVVFAYLSILVLTFPIYITWAATTAGQNFYLPIINKANLPTPTITPTPPGTFEYTVQQGDSLASIALKFGTNIPTLLVLNPEIDPATLIIYVGQIILVPVPPTGNIVIKTFFYNGSGQTEIDKYAEIRNDDSYPRLCKYFSVKVIWFP